MHGDAHIYRELVNELFKIAKSFAIFQNVEFQGR